MPSSLIRTLSVAAVFLTAAVTGRGQGYVPRAQAASPMQPGMSGMMYPQERMSVVDPDKKLAAGDQVTVEIVEDREGGFPRVVTATGELDVPPLGRVKVAGKTANEAAASIKSALDRDYYYSATVRLSIDRVSPVQVKSGTVYLSGEVRVPGPMEIINGEVLTLSNAIAKAGGPTEWANQRQVQITRQVNGKMQTIISDYKKITSSGDATSDPVLQDGDRIFIRKSLVRL